LEWRRAPTTTFNPLVDGSIPSRPNLQFAGLALTEITADRISQARDRLGAPALSFAVGERWLLERNPVSDISRKKEPRGRTRFLTDEERATLLDACGKSDWPALHTLVLLAITTGARKRELIRLKWLDIDLKNGGALVRETKNDEQRTLPVAGKALEALRELKLLW